METINNGVELQETHTLHLLNNITILTFLFVQVQIRFSVMFIVFHTHYCEGIGRSMIQIDC